MAKDIKILLEAKDNASQKVNTFKDSIAEANRELQKTEAANAVADRSFSNFSGTIDTIQGRIEGFVATLGDMKDAFDFGMQIGRFINGIDRAEQALAKFQQRELELIAQVNDVNRSRLQFEEQLATIQGRRAEFLRNQRAEALKTLELEKKIAESAQKALEAKLRAAIKLPGGGAAGPGGANALATVRRQEEQANAIREEIKAQSKKLAILNKQSVELDRQLKLDKARQNVQLGRAIAGGFRKQNAEKERARKKASDDALRQINALIDADENRARAAKRIASLRERAEIRISRLREDALARVAEQEDSQRRRNAETILNNIRNPALAVESRTLTGRGSVNPQIRQQQQQLTAQEKGNKILERTEKQIMRLREDLKRNVQAIGV